MNNLSKTSQALLITGGSSGIGAALALLYAEDGRFSHIFLCGRNRERLNAVKQDCISRNPEITVAVKGLDVRDKEGMRTWINACHRTAPLRLVIAGAGISGGTGEGGESEEAAREIFDINLGGVLNTIHPALDLMTAGRVAVIGSMAGYFSLLGAPAYAASKAGVMRYTEALASHYNQLSDSADLSLIVPGFVKSRITDRNDFKMPFLMGSDRAASIIQRQLDKKQMVIIFPWPMAMITAIMRRLPGGLLRQLLRIMPEKS